MRKLLIWGCGGQGREVRALCELLTYDVIGFLSEIAEERGKIIDDTPVLGDIGEAGSAKREVDVICAGVGTPALKHRFYRKTVDAGFRLPQPVIHPDVRIFRRNSIGVGTVIFGGVQITTNVKIGINVFVNSNVCVGHDAILRDHVTICPGACISGNVIIGARTFVGTGAAIREKINIGSDVVVGGGAFVDSAVPAGMTVVGVPSREIIK